MCVKYVGHFQRLGLSWQHSLLQGGTVGTPSSFSHRAGVLTYLRLQDIW